MRLRSLGLRSDLALIDGETVDRGTHLVVRSPKEPSFYWGNLLVFPSPPGEGDMERWQSCFDREFSAQPEVLHRSFTWDTSASPGELVPFISAGYRYEQTVVLTATAVRPSPHHNAEIEVRALRSASDWDCALALQVASRESDHEEGSYRKFMASRLAGLRARIDRDQGQWYGAFRDGEQLGNLGIFRIGDIARFQIVATHPEARRQGVCGTLVYQVAKATLQRGDVESLVMLADSEYHAARIYESVGFGVTEKLGGLLLRPR